MCGAMTHARSAIPIFNTAGNSRFKFIIRDSQMFEGRTARTDVPHGTFSFIGRYSVSVRWQVRTRVEA
eukprot:6209570-Pleurochrysis_carterae.AAC.4